MHFKKFIYICVISLLPTVCLAITPVYLIKGWNLLGNSDASAIDVAATLGDPSKVITAWKWNNLTGRWAFYAPSMTSVQLANYTQSKGYDILTTIAAKEGYWVNATGQITINLNNLNNLLLNEQDLQIGWNLVSSADNLSPKDLSLKLEASLLNASKSIVTMWNWDSISMQWKFYSPTLELQPGSALINYIQTKNYQSFLNVIPSTEGYWVNVSVSSPLQSTYTGEELSAYQTLNNLRRACGFGIFKQNSKLDIAARGHADWLLLNHSYGHYQTAGSTGFTGAAPFNRAEAAGYINSVDLNSISEEQTRYQSPSAFTKVGYGARAIASLMNAPYHGKGLISSRRDVGIAVRDDNDAGTTASIPTFGYGLAVNINIGSLATDGRQLLGSNDVQTYPCEGSTGIQRQLQNESPNPVPGRDLSLNPLGTSILLMVRDNQVAKITSATVTELVSGTPVVMRAPVNYDNDPNPAYSQPHAVYVSAESPLKAQTKYQVALTGTNDGTPFSRNFTFTTGD